MMRRLQGRSTTNTVGTVSERVPHGSPVFVVSSPQLLAAYIQYLFVVLLVAGSQLLSKEAQRGAAIDILQQ